jgi:hypothetical protein
LTRQTATPSTASAAAARSARSTLSRSSGVDRAAGEHTLLDLEDPPARDERRGPGGVEVDRVGEPQALDFQNVAKPGGDQQGQVCAGSLDDRIQPDRRPVDEVVDLRQLDPLALGQLVQTGCDALRQVGGHGRRLVADQAPGGLVEEAEVGERPADVDSEPIRHPELRSVSAAARGPVGWRYGRR